MPPRDKVTSVSLEAFSARLVAFAAPRRFAIAVSGGRDSMALMRLAAGYGRKTGAEIFAFTVDHGLREGSAAEAAQTAAWCQAAGLACKTLVWTGEKPASGVQAAAREARYRLLLKAAEAESCAALLTAHSADDQAETMFMRLARGAGVRGLSAMSDETLAAAGAGAPLRLLRPLLAFTRAQLTATVETAGQAYIDDPSNDDPAYERVRTRALLAALEEQNLLTGAALVRTAARMRAADERLRRQEEDLFNTLGGCFYGWGGASLDRIERRAGLGGLCTRLIHAVSGEAHSPDAEAALAAAGAACESGAATLGGALIKYWNGRIWFLREPGALAGRTGLAPMARQAVKEPTLWDGRFILRPHSSMQAPDANAKVGPLGDDMAALGPRAAAFSGPGEALIALPGIYQHDALTGAPALPFMESGGFAAKSLVMERFSGGIIRFS